MSGSEAARGSMLSRMHAHEIPDTGLRLAIMNALIGSGRLAEEALRERLADIHDEEHDEDVLIGQALERLRMVELDADALAEIERIDFDGGNDIYMLIEETIDVDTGGETDHYQLGSLAGIERLVALRTLRLDGHGYREATLDLGPLRDHPALATLVLSGRCTNAGVLESLSALAKLDYRLGGLDDESVPERLAARGVEVQRR